jgi:hypothetical protein
LWTAQYRQFRRAAETSEFYFVPGAQISLQRRYRRSFGYEISRQGRYCRLREKHSRFWTLSRQQMLAGSCAEIAAEL